MAPYSTIPIPPFFWGQASPEQFARARPRHTGHVEAGQLIGDGSYEQMDALVRESLQTLDRIYSSVRKRDSHMASSVGPVDLRLSDELAAWKKEQHKLGRVLPAKGFGLRRTTDRVMRLLGAETWPAPLLTTNTIFGAGWASLCIGAFDAATLYSNYCCDMAFYYEHGFHKVFPEFEHVLHQTGHAEPHALPTFAGSERRKASALGVRYIRGKVDLETQHSARLAGQSARLSRRDAQVVSLSESSLIGMAAEAITWGYDPAAVMADMVFSSPATDVIDVGSDLGNSEVMNSFLNTADVTDGDGVVTEAILRRVYDAYAFTGARMLTERWVTPISIMTSDLYTWHMVDDRHWFLRRAVLGWAKARKPTTPDQREADMGEVFDARYHTTVSRPLRNACDGGETCDQAARVIGGHPTGSALLGRLWHDLVLAVLEYVRAGVPDGEKEQELNDRLMETMAQCWHDGLLYEMNWLICHASHHAWQVNSFMEAAMFGGFLDEGTLAA